MARVYQPLGPLLLEAVDELPNFSNPTPKTHPVPPEGCDYP